ncbi:MAG: EamA family transporter [Niastella sp.]|nr:EamA family transporter [Niastella sp.]PZR38379.1 MAG: drug/metabolite-transporting permease [Azospira oryzae]
MTDPTHKTPFLQQKGTRFKALFALGMVCFFWGTTWIASRQGVKHMPALQLAGIRQSIGGLLYVIFFLGKGRTLPRGKEWGPIIILSLLNFALSNGLSTWGVKYISAGLGSIIAATFPLWIVIINMFTVRSGIPAKAVIGLLLGFTGVCVIFYEHLADFLQPEFRFGIMLSLAASWTWAFGTLYTKQQAAAFNPYFSLGLQMLISGILTSVIAIASGQTVAIQEIPWQSWTAIAYLAIFGSVISFIAYLYALQNLPTQQVSIYAYINPMVAVVLGSLIFDEKLTVFIVVGGAITLLGVHLINQAYRKRQS